METYVPDDLLAKYHGIRKQMSLKKFYCSPRMSRIREMWCAANFARAYERHICQCLVRIDEKDSQDDVDFELSVDNQDHLFQVAEVMPPDRRRGDEYKRLAHSPTCLKDWDRGTELGAEWIRAIIQRKLDKKYSREGELNLLLYLNFVEYDLQHVNIRGYCEQVLLHFRSVWLLTGNAICCIKPAPNLRSLEGWFQIPDSTGSGNSTSG